MTPAERKRKEREEKEKAGLVRVEGWVHKSRVDEFRQTTARMQKPKRGK